MFRSSTNSGRPTVILSVLFFTGTLLYFINNDFWQDEIYTLLHFVFIPVKTTISYYPDTNNHIGFNVLANIYRHILGINSLLPVLECPWLMRLIPFSLSVLTVFFLYRLTAKYYGKPAALLAVSLWVSSICIIDFGVQFRGYALNMLLCTLMYFLFLHSIRREKINGRIIFLLVLLPVLSLAAMPIDLYLLLSYMLVCGLLFLKPSLGALCIGKTVQRKQLLIIGVAIAAGTIIGSLYYIWLLKKQPPIEVLNAFTPFRLKSFGWFVISFYHFTGIRVYIYLLLILYIRMIIRKFSRKQHLYSAAFLPGFLFFMHFVFLSIHGALIIERTYLCLIPVFILSITLVIDELCREFQYKQALPAIMALNFVCILFSFFYLRQFSINQNRQSQHGQTLVEHYYLFRFNAKPAAKLARQMIREKNLPLYLCDDFGGTGLDYYLRAFEVPFKQCNDSLNIRTPYIMLANNKKVVEEDLRQKNIPFRKIMDDASQYNLFYCNP